jgi:UDP-N-acetylmuramoyl-tripeptide--D-alanyl-D-alanine ligase
MNLALDPGTAVLIDESYNANPASMRAALALLGQTPVSGGGRRIAVLGDMLELGPHGADLHRDLLEPITAHQIDLVFCCGPLMRALWDALPSERRGGYADDSSALVPRIIGELRAGDAVMVKGSLGSRMGPLVKALERRYPLRRALEDAPAQG